MKNLTLTLILLLHGVLTLAQTVGTLQGVVMDTDTQEEIPFCSIALLDTQGKLVAGTISSESGKFTLEASPANYSLQISFIGYETLLKHPVRISTGTTDLGILQLNQQTHSLEDVVVTGKRSTMISKLDRKSYLASDFATTKSGSATDLLSKLPSISISPDGQEISVRGTNNFLVYLNGKPTYMDNATLLSQIPVESIKSIDVITVPSAKYNAQGNGGVINITTQSVGIKGLTVSAVSNLGGAPWHNATHPYADKAFGDENLNNHRYGGQLNISYGWDKIALSAGISYNEEETREFRTGAARLLDQDHYNTTGSSVFRHMVASGERDMWETNLTTNFGIDYQISSSTLLSGSYLYGNRVSGRSAYYFYNNYFGDIHGNPAEGVDPNNHWVYNPNKMDRNGYFHTFSLNLDHSFNDQNKLSASVLYESSLLNHFQNNYNFDATPQHEVGDETLHFRQIDRTPLQVFGASINYEHLFDNESALQFGFQPQFFQMDGTFNFADISGDALDLELEQYANGIDIDRNIYAAYLDYSGAWSNLQYQAGVRLEYTDQTMEIENPDYFNIFDRKPQAIYKHNKLDWFPSAHLKYAFTDKTALSLAGSRRINRPAIKEMAPFMYRNHYEVYQVGDPNLKPEYSNIIELGFDQYIGSQKINITAFYRGVENAIFRVNTVYPDEMVLIRSYTNSGKTTALGGELNANIVAGKIWDLYTGASLYNYRIESDIFGFQESKSSTNWSIKANTNIKPFKGLTISADIEYKSGTITSQGINGDLFLANAAINYNIPKISGLSVMVKGLDLFNSYDKYLNTRARNAQGTEIFYQDTQYNTFGPIAELTISYTLNPKKGRKKVEAIGNDEF